MKTKSKKLYLVKFKGGGYNTANANSKKEALEILKKSIGEKLTAQIDSWHEGKEAQQIEQNLSSLFW